MEEQTTKKRTKVDVACELIGEFAIFLDISMIKDVPKKKISEQIQGFERSLRLMNLSSMETLKTSQEWLKAWKYEGFDPISTEGEEIFGIMQGRGRFNDSYIYTPNEDYVIRAYSGLPIGRGHLHRWDSQQRQVDLIPAYQMLEHLNERLLRDYQHERVFESWKSNC